MKRFLVTTGLVVLSLVLLIVGFVTVVATTTWGQRLVTQQVNSYLGKKIKAPFRIGSIAYRIPDWIELNDVFFKTPQGDTLLIGSKMRVDLDMMALLQNKVSINQVELERVSLHVTRTLPDTAFNFNYIIDAFNTAQPDTASLATKIAPPADTTSTPLDISLTGARLRKVLIRYEDDVAGANLNAYVDSLRVNFSEVNVAQSRYLISDVTGDKLNVKTRIYDGLPTPTTPSKPGDTLTLGLGKWQLTNTMWDVRVENADFATTGAVGKLAMESDYFHLNGEKIGIKSVAMANSDITTTLLRPQRAVKAARSAEAAVAIKQADPTLKAQVKAEEKAEAAQPIGWIARIGSAKFTNNRIRFDDQTQVRQARGLDYAHLDMNGLGVEGRNLLYSPDRISGQIRQARFKDKSGFTLQLADVDLLYGEKATILSNLFIRTTSPGSPGTILRDRLELRYDSLGQLTRATEGRNLNRVRVLVNLRQSRLAFADVLQLAPFLATTPPFAGNRNEVIRADAQMRGTLADLRIPKADFAMLSGTLLKASGRLTNVTNPDRLGMDLTITDARTNRADMRKLLPKGTLPDSIAIAPSLRLTGKIRGTLNNITTDAKLATNWGSATFDGTLRNFYAGKNEAYRGNATLTKFEAGRWLMDPKQFGTITARATVNGRGLDPATMQTNFRAVVAEAGLMGYSYKNADVNGSLSAGTLVLKGGINDPNIRLSLDTKVGLKTAFPTIAGDVNIQELNLDKLKLYADPLSIKGDIQLAMTSTDPARPEGTVYARDAVVSLKGKTYPIDTLYLKAGTENPGRKTLLLGLPFGQVALSGQFEYTRLYDIVASEIGRYFKIPDLVYKTVQPPYSFYINGQVRQHPLLQAFVPALRKLEPVSLDAYLDNTRDTTFAATMKTGLVDYDTIVVKGSSLALLAYNNQLNVAGQINRLETSSLNIGLTQLSGSAANNRFSFSVVNKDSVDKDRYGLAGLVSLVGNNYRLQVGQRGLLTNYKTWTVDSTGFLQYGPAGVLAQNFLIRQGVQTLSVNSVQPTPNAPLRVEARNVSIGDLASLADQDTTLASGILNSNVVVRDYLTKPAFTGDLKVDSLRVMDKPIGTLTGDFDNASGGRIKVNVSLLSATNDANVSGYYDPSNPKEALDFYLKLNKLDARTIEAFSFGELRRAKGQLRGETDILGSITSPRLNGGISFDSVAFNIKQLNATYRIDQERLRLEGQTMTFTDFNLRDTLGRTLTTDGRVVLSNIPDVSYDLRVRAKNFLALNASRKDNSFFYGQAAVSATLHIVGKGSSPAVDGSVRLEDGSKVTTVLPSDEASLNDARQTVTYINHNDTLALSKYLRPRADTALAPLQFDQLNNSNINLTLEADEKSEITIIVDELNGDNLRARGNARLAVNVSPSGEISVLGRYEVTEGRYSLTYQVLQREFKLQKGGYINFTGDPLKADLNLTAIYETRTTSDALISSETSGQTGSTTKVNLPYNVALTLSGNLAAPTIGFDIIAPRETITRLGQAGDLVSQKLATLREDPNQMNKQVFGLLILGNFIAESSSGSSSGVGIDANNLARGSVSKIISQQLQQFASGLIKGVDLDVGLNSRSGEAETGAADARRTDLNIGLSRSFLQGRLTVSVGKNFLVEGSENVKAAQNNSAVFDNLSLNYNLTRDGRYALRAYRRSNTERTILEGFVIETGVGFVITVDFNTLADLVRRKKDEELE